MVMATTPRVSFPESSPARTGNLKRKLAAVAGAAGAAGAAAIGAADAQAVPYTPTAGIAAASGIPGFSFVDASNVTLGALRAPSAGGTTAWDVDNSGTANFGLLNNGFTAASILGVSGGSSVRVVTTQFGGILQNLATGAQVGSATAGWVTRNQITSSGSFFSSVWPGNTPGQFGFRFTNAANAFYGWGSLTIGEQSGSASPIGQSFVITEAYYNTTPGAAISVGQVPQVVPEPSSMALLGLGAAGIAAWRARRKSQAQAASQAKGEA